VRYIVKPARRRDHSLIVEVYDGVQCALGRTQPRDRRLDELHSAETARMARRDGLDRGEAPYRLPRHASLRRLCDGPAGSG
jgi:hypothetical protein